MSVQFNLLPDIKIQYLKAKRQKHLIVLGSAAASMVALVVFVLLLSVVYGVQKKTIGDLNSDIKTASNKLEGTKDLDKILTVQNQLGALPAMHDKKLVSSRLYNYLSQLTPSDSSINKLNVDFTASTMDITGSAPNLTSVNTYVDSLKFTKYTTKEGGSQKQAFSNVVLFGFTRDNKTATYTINLKFDPVIFSGTEEVDLTVPQIISTRSEVDKPSALFQGTGE